MSTAPLELISHPLCPYVHRAAALLTEKQVPFTLRHIDLKAKPDWFLKISPRGTVPVLVTDGAAIFESNVIVEYLDEISSPHMLPASPLPRAQQRMWIEASGDLVAGHYKIATAATVEARTAAIAAARSTLEKFEAVIVGPYFNGEELGLVDFAAGPGLVRFEILGEELGQDFYAGFPKVAEWSRRISARPAFRSVMVPDFRERFRALIKTV
jgi:glutathione S-transferase